jgi:hypothetical protein
VGTGCDEEKNLRFFFFLKKKEDLFCVFKRRKQILVQKINPVGKHDEIKVIAIKKTRKFSSQMHQFNVFNFFSTFFGFSVSDEHPKRDVENIQWQAISL